MFLQCYAFLSTHLDWFSQTIQHNLHLFITLQLVIMAPFILPYIPYSLIYLNALFVYVCGCLTGLMSPTHEDGPWDRILYALAVFGHYLGRLWHGYEIEGLENVPNEGAALIVYYHGAVPFDMYFMMAQIYLSKNRLIRTVMDRFFFRFPCWGPVLSLIQGTKGSFESCVDILNDGHLLSVAPGGSYEAQFSGNDYRLLWRNRVGYAKVAIQTKSPIIPMFTVNIRESYRAIRIGQSFWEKLYLKWRFPFAPIYGAYPVKLRTIVGKPIAFDPALTVEELNRKVIMEMEQLIKEHQRIPGSITKALMDRVSCQKKVKI